MGALKDVIDVQAGLERLLYSGHITKQDIADVVVPFRDKYGLSDQMALLIARDEVGKQALVDWCARNEDFHTADYTVNGHKPIYQHGELSGDIEWWYEWYLKNAPLDEYPTFKEWWAPGRHSGWVTIKEE